MTAMGTMLTGSSAFSVAIFYCLNVLHAFGVNSEKMMRRNWEYVTIHSMFSLGINSLL